MAFFTVIIPVYNREQFIGEAIGSVLSQTFTDFELLCVDDGSSDNTVTIINEFQKKDARIKLIKHEKNMGRCIARNTGIRNATSNWVCFLDSDDKYYDSHLQTHSGLIHQFPLYNAFATEQTFNKIAKPYLNAQLHQPAYVVTFSDAIFSNPISLNQLSYNRQKITTLFPDERIPVSEDWLFMREFLLHHAIYKINTITTDVTEHDERTMTKSHARDIAKWNDYTGHLFVKRNVLSEKQKRQVLSETMLLCANICLSAGLNNDSRKYLQNSFKYPETYTNSLFYKATAKYFLNLVRF